VTGRGAASAAGSEQAMDGTREETEPSGKKMCGACRCGKEAVGGHEDVTGEEGKAVGAHDEEERHGVARAHVCPVT
jgi:hypothetical protein